MKHPEIHIVLGSLFGDEGKGATVQYLCSEALKQGKKPAVIRFCGGPQAGHTVKHYGITHVCSSFGSGVLLGVPTMYIGEFMVDVFSLKSEYDVLKSKGIEPKLPIFLDDTIRAITPYDVFFNRLDKTNLNNGTCGKGLWSAVTRYNHNDYDHDIFDLNDYSSIPGFASVMNDASLYYSANHPDFYKLITSGELAEDFAKCVDSYRDAWEFLKDEIKKSYFPDQKFMQEFDFFVFEGSQGLLLDAETGLYPHNSATRVGLNAIFDGRGQFDCNTTRTNSLIKLMSEHYGIPVLDENANVHFVMRTYLTRHGNHDKLTFACDSGELKIEEDPNETNVTNEYQGEFFKYPFDFSLLRRAFDRGSISRYVHKVASVDFFITHVDSFAPVGKKYNFVYYDASGILNTIPYCTEYEVVREFANEIPSAIDDPRLTNTGHPVIYYSMDGETFKKAQ